jgi:hypothetical protein
VDNRIFNVNGQGDDLLLDAMRLVFRQMGTLGRAVAWAFDRQQGLILLWSSERQGAHRFPAAMNADECFPLVKTWLSGPESAATVMEGHDRDADHDGHNEIGWRVHCGMSMAICAVKPAYLWFGK